MCEEKKIPALASLDQTWVCTWVRILNKQEKPLLGAVESQEEPSCIPKNILEGASQRAVPRGRNRN